MWGDVAVCVVHGRKRLCWHGKAWWRHRLLVATEIAEVEGRDVSVAAERRDGSERGMATGTVPEDFSETESVVYDENGAAGVPLSDRNVQRSGVGVGAGATNRR